MPSIYDHSYFRVFAVSSTGSTKLQAWYGGFFEVGRLNSPAYTSNVLYARPFFVTVRTWSVDRLGAVSGSTDATQKALLGVYANAAVNSLYPGTLIDQGEITFASGTGMRQVTVNSVILNPHTLYWLAFVSSKSSGVDISGIIDESLMLGQAPGDGDVNWAAWSKTHSYTLPATFPAGATRANAQNVIAPFVHLSA